MEELEKEIKNKTKNIEWRFFKTKIKDFTIFTAHAKYNNFTVICTRCIFRRPQIYADSIVEEAIRELSYKLFSNEPF